MSIHFFGGIDLQGFKYSLKACGSLKFVTLSATGGREVRVALGSAGPFAPPSPATECARRVLNAATRHATE